MNFRRLELQYLAAVGIAGVTAVVLAFLGYGAWALVGQELALAIVSTVLLWIVVPWRPRFTFSKRSFVDLGSFGFRALGGAFFSNLSRNTDNVLIGRFLGANSLGLYSLAYNVMLAPVTRLVGPLHQVLFPALSRIQDKEDALAEAWLRINRLIATICVPFLLGVLVAAPDIVPVVFGHRWGAAAPVLQILCWVGILQCMLASNDVILQACNRVRTYWRFSGFTFAINVVAFVIGLRWGVLGVAASFAVSSTLVALAYTMLISRTLNIRLTVLVRAFSGVLPAAAAVLACASITRVLLINAGVGQGWRVALLAVVVVGAFVPVAAWRSPDLVSELRQFRGRRVPMRRSLDIPKIPV